MPVIRISPQVRPHQVEDFPKDCERSCKGALHVRPNETTIVTKGELAHLQALKTPLQVVQMDDPSKVRQEAPKALDQGGGGSTPVAAPQALSGAAGDGADPDSGSVGSKAPKKGGK